MNTPPEKALRAEDARSGAVVLLEPVLRYRFRQQALGPKVNVSRHTFAGSLLASASRGD